MKKSVQELSAVKALEDGNELAAQQIFREEVKMNPCCETWNNLGVYYWLYGMHLPNGKIVRADKLGMRYLKKASLYGVSFYNCVSLASAQCEQRQYNDAQSNFAKAYAQSRDSMVAYNLGACLYRLNEYDSAVHYLESIGEGTDLEKVLMNDGQHPLIVIAYCEFKLGKIKACLERLDVYRKRFPNDELLDVFVLLFLCGRHEEAMSGCVEMLREWYATEYICAMIAECINHKPQYNVELLREYTSRVERIITLINDAKLRKELIAGYQYVPPVIKMYQFSEVPKEN